MLQIKHIIFAFCVFVSFSSFGDEKNFGKLISEYGEYNKVLDSAQVYKYFGVSLHPEHAPSAYADKIIVKTSDFIGLTCKIPCTAGGMCESTVLRIFDYKGNVIDELKMFEFYFADCSDDNHQYCTFNNDTVIILINENIQEDCASGERFKHEIKKEEILIDRTGRLVKKSSGLIDTRREFFNISCSLLNDNDLKGKSKQELSVMRNEIFASYGYRFKTKYWSDFFNDKKWYSANFDNVDNLLSIIEKKNIELIRKHETK